MKVISRFVLTMLAVVSVSGWSLRAKSGVQQTADVSRPGPGTEIQFDSKGVDFGPWLDSFIRTVKSNLVKPQTVLKAAGRVVVRLNVHKDGSLTDIEVIEPAAMASFNVAIVTALKASNRAVPLPPAYPVDPLSMILTFRYDEINGLRLGRAGEQQQAPPVQVADGAPDVEAVALVKAFYAGNASQFVGRHVIGSGVAFQGLVVEGNGRLSQASLALTLGIRDQAGLIRPVTDWDTWRVGDASGTLMEIIARGTELPRTPEERKLPPNVYRFSGTYIGQYELIPHSAYVGGPCGNGAHGNAAFGKAPLQGACVPVIVSATVR